MSIWHDIPDHDILCAGFPCQPFSKATPTDRRTGFDDPDQGDLFDYVIDILKAKEPRYFILENVPNLQKHDSGQTWEKILENLKEDDKYQVNEGCFSPHQFGIPQIRRRLFIVGNRFGPAQLPEPTLLTVNRILGQYLLKIRPMLGNCPNPSKNA